MGGLAGALEAIEFNQSKVIDMAKKKEPVEGVQRRNVKVRPAPKRKVKKPLAPKLQALIRVKGIIQAGDPKNNEAIIQVIRSGHSVFCKVGDEVAGGNAKVVQIGDGVTFEYLGKNVKLGIRQQVSQAKGLLAGPEGQASFAQGGKR